MPKIPPRLPREYESPSPDHHPWYTGVVNTVLRYSNLLHLHQRVCHKVGDTMVRTSRFTGDKGKDGKGKYGKSFGKYDKNNEYSKNNEYGKGSEKGKEKRK